LQAVALSGMLEKQDGADVMSAWLRLARFGYLLSWKLAFRDYASAAAYDI
jgi:hypothetical protein